MALNIAKHMDGASALVVLEGRLDTNTAPELEKELKDVLEQVSELKLDLEKLEYTSSAGLLVLLTAHKALMNRGGLKILHPNEVVMETFTVTGFTRILHIE